MVQTQPVEFVHADMNDSWKAFLHEQVNTFVKWDLVRFFHDNPHTAETAAQIAQFIGRDVSDIQDELDELVEAGLLHVKHVSRLSIYRLSTDEATRRLVKRFVSACYNRQFREQAINVIHRVSAAQRSYN